MKMPQLLQKHRASILQLAAQRGACRVRVFGSVARGEERPDSDVDFLVDFEPGRSLLDLVGLEQDLTELLGRKVDVVVDGGLSPYMEKHILAEAQAL